MKALFAEHISTLQARYEQAVDGQDGIDGLLIHSGVEQYYYADDQAIPFRGYGHFCHWLPVNRPGQALLIRPGRRPLYFQVIKPDYWYDQTIDNADWWADQFDIITLTSDRQIRQHIDYPEQLAFLGEPSPLATELGIPGSGVNPRSLLHYLDFWRACKSEYEIEQIRAANRLALQGHEAASACFLAGGSEYAIHMAYLQGSQLTEPECPYTNIVALDEKAAILHYQNKRQQPAEGRVLLIDAGHRVNNYCSDITRTTARAGHHDVFDALLSGMEDLQQRLVAQVKPGLAYLGIHRQAMQEIASLAIDLELIDCDLEQALALNLPGLFMPHGVGHLLGLQVHDVGGHLSAPDGSRALPPEQYPFLRNTRTLAHNMVFTIEPGFYFIPLLLEPEREAIRGRHLNWRLLDSLLPFGGVRIEDNVRVTASGVENLTRQ